MREFNNQAIVAAFVTGLFALVVGFMSGKGATQVNQTPKMSQEVVVNLPDSQSESLSLEAAGGRIERLSKEVAATKAQVGILQKELSACQLSSSKPSPLPGPAAPQATAQELRGDGYVFSFGKCFASGTSITCSLRITGDEDGKLLLHTDDRTRLFDDLGNDYSVAQASFGKEHYQGTHGVSKTLISGISVEATFTFRGISPESSSIAVVEVSYRAPGTSWASSGKFRDIALSKRPAA